MRDAITLALKDASLSPEDIDYMSVSANSTRGLDRMETEVLRDVFGEHAYKIPVSSIKSMTGESFSASGALALSAAVGVIQNGIIPPTVNYEEKDPECDLDYVPNVSVSLGSRPQRCSCDLILSYGQNTAVILEKY